LNTANRKIVNWIFFVCLAVLLQGCGKNYTRLIADNYKATNKRLVTLQKKLDQDQLTNAVIVKTYAKSLKTLKPEFASIADALAKDATSRGNLYQNLTTRLRAVKRKPANEKEYIAGVQELDNLYVASDPPIFNDSLMDLANTLSDLSEGKLPHIDIPKTATEAAKLQNKKVAGSYLVGNPSYGNWSTNSSGQSYWAWYGQYSFMSNMLGGGYHSGPIYYNDWYSRPRYSYYHDYGRSAYGTRTDRSYWSRNRQSLPNRGTTSVSTKQYGSVASRRRISTYNRSRGTTGTRPTGFGSQSRRRSTYSSYSSGSRSSSSSRSSWGGK